ncbi:unnamed protein product [Amoebophrya sp. A25]|nr:unnamed protein product [Amoebophrya sp. A25]|eukprot:GSA25T00010824001.1
MGPATFLQLSREGREADEVQAVDVKKNFAAETGAETTDHPKQESATNSIRNTEQTNFFSFQWSAEDVGSPGIAAPNPSAAVLQPISITDHTSRTTRGRKKNSARSRASFCSKNADAGVGKAGCVESHKSEVGFAGARDDGASGSHENDLSAVDDAAQRVTWTGKNRGKSRLANLLRMSSSSTSSRAHHLPRQHLNPLFLAKLEQAVAIWAAPDHTGSSPIMPPPAEITYTDQDEDALFPPRSVWFSPEKMLLLFLRFFQYRVAKYECFHGLADVGATIQRWKNRHRQLHEPHQFRNFLTLRSWIPTHGYASFSFLSQSHSAAVGALESSGSRGQQQAGRSITTTRPSSPKGLSNRLQNETRRASGLVDPNHIHVQTAEANSTPTATLSPTNISTTSTSAVAVTSEAFVFHSRDRLIQYVCEHDKHARYRVMEVVSFSLAAETWMQGGGKVRGWPGSHDMEALPCHAYDTYEGLLLREENGTRPACVFDTRTCANFEHDNFGIIKHLVY